MTISEQLQFSVLTAPLASVDRRTLSQAWYSALYGGGGASRAQTSALREAPAGAAASVRSHAAHAATQSGAGVARSPQTGSVKAPPQEGAAPVDRRAARSTLARKIERAFLQPRSAARKAAFTVEGDQGRVHVLLQSRGTQLKLVAICPPKARAQVAAALAQARYALALRGIDLDADARGAGEC